jgi:immune inhibitor A
MSAGSVPWGSSVRKPLVALFCFLLTVAFVASGTYRAAANPPVGSPQPSAKTAITDDHAGPQEDKRRALRERAVRMVLNGQAKVQTINGSKVVKVGKQQAPLSASQQAKVRAGGHVKAKMVDQYVELRRERTDKIFVVLAEFGNERHPKYPDQDTDPRTAGPATFDGPLHNAIPKPDRTTNNRTIWQADYSAAYYRKLYFGKAAGTQSLKTYYEKQSSGRYSVNGMVTDWVKVRYNEARYGRSNGYPCSGNVCSNTSYLLQDAVDQWVADQKAAGQTDAQIKTSLSSYDEWDRYDYDGDGNFNEPDGYLDHFQVVHAGGDQADGDPYQGEDAIWSHRSNAFLNSTSGPDTLKIGGFQVGKTGLWVSDYTVQPENGGLSVFTHEYGHDLGLPDLYDQSGLPQRDAVSWWSLMAQSRLSARNDEGIGTRPGDLGAWDKLQLGWLDYEVALAGQKRTYKLGPHEYNSGKPQGLVVVLPKKSVLQTLATPVSGTRTWWSGQGDSLDNSMSRSVTLPAGSSSLSFQAQYDIEDCDDDPCDYAYVEVDDGSGWKAIPGDITTSAEGNGIDGTTDGWVPATFDLSAYAGKTVGLRVRYLTDGAAQGNDPSRTHGIFIDDLTITAGATTVFSDGAETSPNGWTLDGFASVGSTRTLLFDNYYIASHRAYVSYDRYLKTGPYNFGSTARPNYVEHFPYQDGLLVSYWDTSQSNNTTSDHPGEGEILPIDAHPRPIYRLDGNPWRGRVSLYDATFGRQKADSFTLHNADAASYIRGQAARPLFDDTRTYWYAEDPYTGVKTPKVGVTLKVTKQSKTHLTVKLGKSTKITAADVRASLGNR